MSNWIERDKKVVWHPFTQAQTESNPLVVVKAKDSLLFDQEGKSYIDCNSSWWVNIHGHNHPKLMQALRDQTEILDHVLLAGVTHPKAIELAEKVLNLLPKSFEKVFFSDNGSTAIEVALKMVIQYFSNANEPRKRIIAMEGAYHGDTFGAMSAGQRGYFNKPFEPFFFDVDFIQFPDGSNDQNVIAHFEKIVSSNEIAAFIVEPLVQGSAGMRIYSAKTLDTLVALAKKAGVLVIFDEVMTGWGRTGTNFALDQVEVKPDIICLSKGLSGGALPLALTVATIDIFNRFLSEDKLKAFLHGHSYTGNALACSVACASVDLFTEKTTMENIKRIETSHKAELSRLNLFKNLKVNVLGTILSIEFSEPEGSNYFSSKNNKAGDFFLSRGMFLRPLGNVIFLNPPYCITDQQLEICYAAIRDFLREEN